MLLLQHALRLLLGNSTSGNSSFWPPLLVLHSARVCLLSMIRRGTDTKQYRGRTEIYQVTNTRRHGLHQSVCAKRSKPHPALAPDMQSGHRVGGSATLAWPPLSLEQPLAESALRQVLLLDDVNHRLSRRVEERRSTVSR